MATDRTALGANQTGPLASLARTCARHRWPTLGAWLIFALVVFVGAGTIGGTLVDEFTIPNSDAQRATDLLEENFPSQSGEAAQVVFAVEEGAVSRLMGLDRLRDHQRAGVEVIASTDLSCLLHLEGLARREGVGVRALHVAEILAGASGAGAGR